MVALHLLLVDEADAGHLSARNAIFIFFIYNDFAKKVYNFIFIPE